MTVMSRSIDHTCNIHRRGVRSVVNLFTRTPSEEFLFVRVSVSICVDSRFVLRMQDLRILVR